MKKRKQGSQEKKKVTEGTKKVREGRKESYKVKERKEPGSDD